jgi:hypothetical protein
MIKRALSSTALVLAWAGASPASPAEVWDFKVYLDDKPVGYHRFTLSERATGKELRSEARFDVKFLFVTAYTYAHQATERWKGDCVENLRANTDDNGAVTYLSGRLDGKRFRLNSLKGVAELPECVMSFAYWHPDMLKQSALLNPQTGEYTSVSTTPLGTESIPVKGKALAAKRYRLDAGKFQIDLWYATDDHRWLALDSNLEGGHRLRYRLEGEAEKP